MSFSKFVVFTLVGRQTFLLLLPFIKSQGRIELVYIFIVHKQRLVIPASDLETFFIVTIISLWYVGCRFACVFVAKEFSGVSFLLLLLCWCSNSFGKTITWTPTHTFKIVCHFTWLAERITALTQQQRQKAKLPDNDHPNSFATTTHQPAVHIPKRKNNNNKSSLQGTCPDYKPLFVDNKEINKLNPAPGFVYESQ